MNYYYILPMNYSLEEFFSLIFFQLTLKAVRLLLYVYLFSSTTQDYKFWIDSAASSCHRFVGLVGWSWPLILKRITHRKQNVRKREEAEYYFSGFVLVERLFRFLELMLLLIRYALVQRPVLF